MTKSERDTQESERISNDDFFEDDEENGVETLIVSPPSFRERLDAARRARATDEMPAAPLDQATTAAH